VASGGLSPTATLDPQQDPVLAPIWEQYKQEMEPSMVGAAARGAISQLGPTVGGVAGGGAGSMLGPVGAIGGGLAGAAAGGAMPQSIESEFRTPQQQIAAQGVSPADQLYREQAGRTSANTFARGAKGARSGTDLMSLAGLVGGQENQQMQNINIESANRGDWMRRMADQNMVGTIAQTAAATARERGLEFESILNKSNAGINLAREKGLGEMDQNWNLGQTNMAQRGALANSSAALFSGIGGIFRSMGGGIAQQNMQNQQMELLRGQMGLNTPQASNFNPSAFDAIMRKDLMSLSGYTPTASPLMLPKPKPTGWGTAGVPQ